jgi:indole-3-glycerol phosphate synthase
MPADFLSRILEAKRAEVAARKGARPLRPTRLPEERRGAFAAALAAEGLSLIAEIKRASPSKGVLRADLDPRELALIYRAAGARAISVLTDEPFFRGSLADLEAARAAELPLLRKDFVIDPYQVWEAAAAGASAVLLIVTALAGEALGELLAAAEEAGLDALVEAHDRTELERALAAGAKIVGLNSRNLRTFETDLDAALELAPRLPRGVLNVIESGIHDRFDVRRVRAVGANAVLIVETLVTAIDPAQKIAELLGDG